MVETGTQFAKIESQHALRLIKLMGGVVLKIDPNDPYNIDIPHALDKRINYKQVRAANEQIYMLGKKNVLGTDEKIQLSGMDDYVLAQLTEQVVGLLGRIGQEMTPSLQTSLIQGFKEGETYEKLTQRIQAVWDIEQSNATRIAVTASNEIYNQAHLSGYKEIGAEYVQFKALIDQKTSELCRMTHQTIWAIDDPDILRPPLHFHCRSRLVAYFGKPPKKERDFQKRYDGVELTQQQVDENEAKITTFKTKYWQMPTILTPAPTLQTQPVYTQSAPGFVQTDPKVFVEIRDKIPKEKQIYFTPYTPEEIKEKGIKVWIAESKQAGVALKGNEIVNLFSFKKGEGEKALIQAIKMGGRRLDCFDKKPGQTTGLVDYYKKYGFKEVKREKNWTPGEPDVVYMELG